ncbi:cold shock and DUF1294 domain-containing protein [Roseateles saccharophilus]|uniref:Uncharacterized membrane protein YsdA (DUF1294 family) n=1 Tax=Roseateles saccharophilus TaxID=304 RepID=A0A4R3VF08_ROSSA|nr:cold shock and DUF1294 domain-containing protein [Roseateles saccharophilus]MDG0833904.1 DUF1294 domain-containing protein [Roseateles saccharophilus]TCV02274.1 uncharacterized membrane protein YsdA (DUF1294 family) [Roseateles saccharophilus]
MKKGSLAQWDDAKGYGFISPDDGAPKLFVHIKAFGLRPGRPFVGERLGYREGQDAQGKRRALDVRSLQPRAAPPAPRPRDGGRVLLLVPAFAGLVLAVYLLWGLPNWLWGLYSAMSMASFIVYALDKRAATRGDWRVKEGTLHALSLACGWPGALLAQRLLRHKSVKPRFRRVFWLTVVLNIAAFVALFTPLLRS